MPSTELINYIRSQIDKGVPEDAILGELRSKQWEESVIQEAMNEIHGGATTSTNSPAMMEEPMAGASLDSLPVMDAPLTASMPTAETSGGSRSKLWMIIGIIVAAVLIIGGGATAGYFMWYQAPDRVAAKMLENMASLQAVEFEAVITPDANDLGVFNALDPAIKSLNLVLSGRSNMLDVQHPVSTVTASVNMTGKNGQQSFGIEARNVDSIIYLRPTSPVLGPLDLSFLEDRWIKLDPTSTPESLGGLLPEDVTSQIEPSNIKLTEQEVDQIRQAFSDNKFVAVEAATGSIEIHGVKTKSYPTTIDRDALASFVEAVSPILKGKGATTEQISELVATVRSTDFPTINLWIGTDYQLYRVNGTLAPKTAQGPVTWTVDLWNHNQAFTVETPVDTVDLASFVQDFMGRMFSDTTLPSTDETDDTSLLVPVIPGTEETDVTVLPSQNPLVDDSVIDPVIDDGTDTDGDGLTDVEEVTYGTDPALEDTDGDTFLDGAEVENGYNPAGPGKLLSQNAKENDAERVSELKALENSLDLYFSDNQRYPAVGDDWQDLGDDLAAYINGAQADPEHPSKVYTYFVNNAGSEFVLHAVLEDEEATGLALDLDGLVGGEGYDGISSDDNFQQTALSCDDPAFCVGS